MKYFFVMMLVFVAALSSFAWNNRNHYNSNGTSAGWSTPNGNTTNYYNSNGTSAGWSR